MKKFIPYLFGFLLLVVLVLLVATSKNKVKKKTLDERITLSKQDKIPYGTYAAYHSLNYLFPQAIISDNSYEPGYWDSLSKYESKQALLIITRNFAPDVTEMEKLIAFAENGNDVFISAGKFSVTALDMMDCSLKSPASTLSGPAVFLKDSLKVYLDKEWLGAASPYQYPGRTSGVHFFKLDSNIVDVLGTDENQFPNFIKLYAGKGNFYVHTDPFVFTNYFLLHKQNMEYFEKALSVIPADVTRVVWDEYYLNKKEKHARQSNENSNPKKRGWLATLMNVKNGNGDKSFGAAFWVLAAVLLLYVLMNMRRKQRYIPLMRQPQNESLDFVRTIGRLYYDKGDHKNLCRKMASFFLEHVRSRYQLPTGLLNEAFVKNLLYKSGAEADNVATIVTFINGMDGLEEISGEQLTAFYNQLEKFYQTTK